MEMIIAIMVGIFISITISTITAAYLIGKATDKIWSALLELSETLKECIKLKAN